LLARLLGKFERIDIRADGRFDEDWRGLCLEHGIKAIQSRPALAADGTPLGTFVLGFREPVELGGWDDALMAWGTSLAGLALERQRLRERDAMLFGDLQHRIKNIFAIIGAVSHFTFRGTPEIESIRAVFDRRLAALASSHTSARQTDLRTLIENMLAPYGEGRGITLSGPRVAIPPRHRPRWISRCTNWRPTPPNMARCCGRPAGWTSRGTWSKPTRPKDSSN
jgi:hypothetical protein